MDFEKGKKPHLDIIMYPGKFLSAIGKFKPFGQLFHPSALCVIPIVDSQKLKIFQTCDEAFI